MTNSTTTQNQFLPFTGTFTLDKLFGGKEIEVKLNAGFTVFLGPNGAGKSQVLRTLKNYLKSKMPNQRIVRLLTSGRLAKIDLYRTIGSSQGTPDFDSLSLGGTNDAVYRNNTESIVGDLHTLSLRPDLQIKIKERLGKLFGRKLYLNWDNGHLKPTFSVNGQFYSSSREASGLLHLIGLLTALYNETIGALLIDEPEISLHPQLQSFLLNEIVSAQGDPADESKKVVIIATHSTAMVPLFSLPDIVNFVFFKDLDTAPIQFKSNNRFLSYKQLPGLISRMTHSHRDCLFSTKPLFVEGPSDEIICNTLSRNSSIHLEAVGGQVTPVIGKGEFAAVVALFKNLGKDVSILADLDAFTDDFEVVNRFCKDKIANAAAVADAHGSLLAAAKGVREDMCKLVSDDWESVQDSATRHSYWKYRNASTSKDILHRRAAIATLLSLPDADLESSGFGENWQNLKARINRLFSYLSLAGCFFLEKGTIEDYYFAEPDTNRGKPAAAIEEVASWSELDDTDVFERYSEIIGVLKQVAQGPPIDEQDALRDIILSFIGPIIGQIRSGNTEIDLNALAKEIVNEKSTIFKLFLVRSKSGQPSAVLVDIESKVLDTTKFPIEFPIDADPITIANTRLIKSCEF